MYPAGAAPLSFPARFQLIAGGILYLLFLNVNHAKTGTAMYRTIREGQAATFSRPVLVPTLSIILLTSIIGDLVFQRTTFGLPKVFDERLSDMVGSTTSVGACAFVAFTIASFAQLVVRHLLDKHSVRTVFAIVALLQAVHFFTMTQLDGMS